MPGHPAAIVRSNVALTSGQPEGGKGDLDTEEEKEAEQSEDKGNAH